jgi:xanthine dehydrogenase accessory factor
MEPVFRAALEELKNGRQSVVASVVKTSGSTPQKPGAKLLVRADGSGVGTLGGGCVEGDIWFAAKQIMKRGGTAEMRDYVLNEDLAARDGLICGGTMYFLIDPLRGQDAEAYEAFASEVVAAYEGGKPVAIVNLMVPAAGHQGGRVGSKMLVREDGSTAGTLGVPALDQDAVRRARDLMALGKTDYVVSDTGAEYFIEAYTTPPTLVVAGGGHVSKALASIAKSVGFRLFILDDRPEFANKERFPEAEIVKVGDYATGLKELPINPNSFIVVATRGHRYDDSALAAALETRASYVGLLGSKRKTILIYEELLKRGFSVDRLRAVRAPIGLDISGRTPEEIAISIMAEILMFRLGGNGGPMKLDEKQFQRLHERVERKRVPAAAS